jgi:hypothetical protein
MSCGGGHLEFSIGIKKKKGKCSNAFFSETTYIIKAKLYMNVHWMVLYKLYVFCSDMKFKDRNFVEELPMIIPGQFGFNCPSGFREEAF